MAIFMNSLKPPEEAISGWAISKQGPLGPTNSYWNDSLGLNPSVSLNILRLHKPADLVLIHLFSHMNCSRKRVSMVCINHQLHVISYGFSDSRSTLKIILDRKQPNPGSECSTKQFADSRVAQSDFAPRSTDFPANVPPK